MRGVRAALLMTALGSTGPAFPGAAAAPVPTPRGGMIPAPVVMTADTARPATQFAGLFVQACMAFAGDAAGLRGWAAKTGLPALPDQVAAVLLHNAPGRAFDASPAGTKLALVSSDDGICAVVTDRAAQAAVTESLEAALTQAGVAFRLAIDRDDTRTRPLHFREYLATRTSRSWRILAATVNDPVGGQAMLTAAPE